MMFLSVDSLQRRFSLFAIAKLQLSPSKNNPVQPVDSYRRDSIRLWLWNWT